MGLGASIRFLVTNDSGFKLRNVAVTSKRIPPGARMAIQHVYWYQLMEFILNVIMITVFFSTLAAAALGYIAAFILVIVANVKRFTMLPSVFLPLR